MNQVNGVVTDIRPEQRVSRAGKNFTIFIVNVDGTDYEAGFNKPAWSIGETVSFNSEVKYGKNAIVAAQAAGVQSKKPTYNKAGGGGFQAKPFPLPKTHGDTAIIRQNALTNAREFVCSQLNTDVYDSLNTEMLIEHVIDVAYKFAEFSSGQREERMAKEMQNQPIGQIQE